MKSEELSVSEKAILIGLFLAKFDRKSLESLGFTSFLSAFNTLSYAIGVKPATIKNYRDEFDPYFPNNRKGWHNRNMKAYCQPIFERFSCLSFEEYVTVVNHLVIPKDLQISAPEKLINSSESVAKRLVTGKSAEAYFQLYYQLIPDFFEHEIKDTTQMACGYDFETIENGTRCFCVEVKGLSQKSGSIMLTEKEYYVAQQLKEKYCLFIVFDFEKKPQHRYCFDPLNSGINFKRTERQITQITYNAVIS